MPVAVPSTVVNGSQSAPAFSHSVKDQHHPVPAVETTPSTLPLGSMLMTGTLLNR